MSRNLVPQDVDTSNNLTRWDWTLESNASKHTSWVCPLPFCQIHLWISTFWPRFIIAIYALIMVNAIHILSTMMTFKRSFVANKHTVDSAIQTKLTEYFEKFHTQMLSRYHSTSFPFFNGLSFGQNHKVVFHKLRRRFLRFIES